jgi:hypothetical protein
VSAALRVASHAGQQRRKRLDQRLDLRLGPRALLVVELRELSDR